MLTLVPRLTRRILLMSSITWLLHLMHGTLFPLTCTVFGAMRAVLTLLSGGSWSTLSLP